MRVAVLSDIHANLAALDAVIASFGSVDAVWHLGDVVGYGPERTASSSACAGIGAVGVRGNHDAAAVGGDEIEWFNPDARAAMEWTRRRIADTTRAWLTALPTRPRRSVRPGPWSPREPLWEYIVSVPVARANLAALTTEFGLYGIPTCRWSTPSAMAVSSRSSRPTVRGSPCWRPGADQPGQRRSATGWHRDRELSRSGHGRRSLHLAKDALRHRGRAGGDASGWPAGASRGSPRVRPVSAFG